MSIEPSVASPSVTVSGVRLPSGLLAKSSSRSSISSVPTPSNCGSRGTSEITSPRVTSCNGRSSKPCRQAAPASRPRAAAGASTAGSSAVGSGSRSDRCRRAACLRAACRQAGHRRHRCPRAACPRAAYRRAERTRSSAPLEARIIARRNRRQRHTRSPGGHRAGRREVDRRRDEWLDRRAAGELGRSRPARHGLGRGRGDHRARRHRGGEDDCKGLVAPTTPEPRYVAPSPFPEESQAGLLKSSIVAPAIGCVPAIEAPVAVWSTCVSTGTPITYAGAPASALLVTRPSLPRSMPSLWLSWMPFCGDDRCRVPARRRRFRSCRPRRGRCCSRSGSAGSCSPHR